MKGENVMKKQMFVTVLAVSLLLSACTSTTPVSPKFKHYSNKVDYQTFTKSVDEAGEKLNFDEEQLWSYTSSDDVYRATETKVKNAELKKDAVVSEKYREVFKYQYDKNNNILTVDRQRDISQLQETVGSKQNAQEITNNTSAALQFEELQVGENKDLVVFVKSNKSYYDLGPNTAKNDLVDNKVSAVASIGVLLPVLSYVSASSLYERVSAAEKEKFNFYVDKNVFTITYVYNESVSLEQKLPTDDDPDILENVEVATGTKTRDVKIQLVINKNNLTLAYKDVGKTTVNYLRDYSSYNKGDVLTEEATEYCTASIEKKSINLKAMKVASYTKLDGDLKLYDLLLD